MTTNLATNRDHLAAATSLRRARNALIHAKLSPHTAERELENVRFWRTSAAHHRSFAAFNTGRVVRTWAPCRPTWEDELELLFGTSAVASLTEVE
jgi:hypothetical protein